MNTTRRIRRDTIAVALAGALALGITACSDDTSDTSDTTTSSTASDTASSTYDYYMLTGIGAGKDITGNITGTPEKTDPSTPYDVIMIINPSTLLVRDQQGGDSFFVHMINAINGKASNTPAYSLESAQPELPAVTDEQIDELTDPKNYGTVSAQRYALAKALAEHGGVVYLEEDPTITEQAIKDSNNGDIVTNNDGGIAFRSAYVWFSPEDERSGNFASSLNGILLEKSNAQCSPPDHYGFQSEVWRAQSNPDEYDLSTEQCGDVPAYYEIGEPIKGRNVNDDASDLAKKRAAERGITDNWGDESWGLDMTEKSYHLVGTKYRKQADELAKVGYDKYMEAIENK